MAINNLKIGCFDVKVSGYVGTGHHTVIEAPCTIYIGKTDQFRFLGNCPPKLTLTLSSHLGQNVGLGEG